MELEAPGEPRLDSTQANPHLLVRSGRPAPVTDFVALAEASHDAVITFDQSGLIRSWNTAAARLFGYSEAEAVGRPTTDLVVSEEATTQQARTMRILDGERIHRIGVSGRRRDGSLIPMTVTMVPIDRGQGG